MSYGFDGLATGALDTMRQKVAAMSRESIRRGTEFDMNRMFEDFRTPEDDRIVADGAIRARYNSDEHTIAHRTT
ncbi:MAG: hypothetical protein ACLSHP_05080 [Coprococcus sp.]